MLRSSSTKNITQKNRSPTTASTQLLHRTTSAASINADTLLLYVPQKQSNDLSRFTRKKGDEKDVGFIAEQNREAIRIANQTKTLEQWNKAKENDQVQAMPHAFPPVEIRGNTNEKDLFPPYVQNKIIGATNESPYAEINRYVGNTVLGQNKVPDLKTNITDIENMVVSIDASIQQDWQQFCKDHNISIEDTTPATLNTHLNQRNRKFKTLLEFNISCINLANEKIKIQNDPLAAVRKVNDLFQRIYRDIFTMPPLPKTEEYSLSHNIPVRPQDSMLVTERRQRDSPTHPFLPNFEGTLIDINKFFEAIYKSKVNCFNYDGLKYKWNEFYELIEQILEYKIINDEDALKRMMTDPKNIAALTRYHYNLTYMKSVRENECNRDKTVDTIGEYLCRNIKNGYYYYDSLKNPIKFDEIFDELSTLNYSIKNNDKLKDLHELLNDMLHNLTEISRNDKYYYLKIYDDTELRKLGVTNSKKRQFHSTDELKYGLVNFHYNYKDYFIKVLNDDIKNNEKIVTTLYVIKKMDEIFDIIYKNCVYNESPVHDGGRRRRRRTKRVCKPNKKTIRRRNGRRHSRRRPTSSSGHRRRTSRFQ